MRLHYSSREQTSEVGRWRWVCLTLPRKEKGPGLISYLTGRSRCVFLHSYRKVVTVSETHQLFKTETMIFGHCSKDPGFNMDMASDHFYTTGSNHFSRGANDVWTR